MYIKFKIVSKSKNKIFHYVKLLIRSLLIKSYFSRLIDKIARAIAEQVKNFLIVSLNITYFAKVMVTLFYSAYKK